MIERVDITELQDEYVICRTLGHSWDDFPNGEVDSVMFKQSRGVLCLRCTRCFAERYDYINVSMEVFHRYYRYPQRYNTIVGQGKRPNLRGEMFRRSLLVQQFQNGKTRARKR